MAGVGVPRPLEHLLDRPGLDDPAAVHHAHAVRDLAHDGQIVGDEQQRHPEPLLEVLQQLQDLRLDGDVERGGRLVGDQQVGLVRERHRDHHPLALAAGELVRIGAEALLGLAQARPDAAARARAPARPPGSCPRWSISVSPICRSIVCSGLSEVIGSWKIMPTRSPRTSRRRRAVGADQLAPSRRIEPPGCQALGYGRSCRIESAVTDLPEPLSPTSASVSPRSIAERHVFDRLERAALDLEADRQVVDLEQAHRGTLSGSVLRGSKASRTASPMNTSSDSITAITTKPVIPSQGACEVVSCPG